MKLEMNELVTFAWGLLAGARETMNEDGDIPMTFVLLTKDGTIEHVSTADSRVINSPTHKDLIALAVRERCKQIKAGAVLMLSDTFMGKMTTKSGASPAERKAAIELAELVHSIGTEEAERRGIIKRREAIVCQINLPRETKQIFWFYRREGDRAAGTERIIWEETEEMDADFASGRLSGYFDHLETVQ